MAGLEPDDEPPPPPTPHSLRRSIQRPPNGVSCKVVEVMGLVKCTNNKYVEYQQFNNIMNNRSNKETQFNTNMFVYHIEHMRQGRHNE